MIFPVAHSTLEAQTNQLCITCGCQFINDFFSRISQIIDISRGVKNEVMHEYLISQIKFYQSKAEAWKSLEWFSFCLVARTLGATGQSD